MCISSYSKTLCRQIIYALFSQTVVGSRGLCPPDPTGAPSLEPLGDFYPKLLICPPLEKILRAPMRQRYISTSRFRCLTRNESLSVENFHENTAVHFVSIVRYTGIPVHSVSALVVCKCLVTRKLAIVCSVARFKGQSKMTLQRCYIVHVLALRSSASEPTCGIYGAI